MRLPEPPLLVITDRRQARRPLEEIAAAAFAGGCRWLSLREKDLAAVERRSLLCRLVEIGRPWGALVGVHEDIEAAAAAAAGAVHLPDGRSPQAARARLAPGTLIGASAHDASGVARAAAEGADYVTLSPIFLTASKPGYGPALGIAALAEAVSRRSIPILALGGIDAVRAAQCRDAGAAGIAVMGAVMAAASPQDAVRRLLDGLVSGPCPGPARSP